MSEEQLVALNERINKIEERIKKIEVRYVIFSFAVDL